MDDCRDQIGGAARILRTGYVADRERMSTPQADSREAFFQWSFHKARKFDEFAECWDELNDAASGLPILCAAFVKGLLDEFGDGTELVAIAKNSSSIEAMAVLRRIRAGFWETFQPSQAPLGVWIQRGPEQSKVLAQALVRSLPGFGVALGITQQDPELSSRPALSPGLETLDYIQTARVTISGGFDEYWAARGKNLRTNTKRQHARLEKEGVQARLETVTDARDVVQALDDYGRLESAGWKGANGTAIHPNNAQGRFYRALMEGFCKQGLGRIYRYKYGNSIVAVDICVERGPTLVVLKTTYDESIRDSSPATLLRYAYFQEIFSDKKIRRIEFYGKLMDWHTKWTDEVRTLHHANFYKYSWLTDARAVIAAVSRRKPDISEGASYETAVYTNIDALVEKHAALFANGQPNVFQTLPWYKNFIETALTRTERVRIYAVDRWAVRPTYIAGPGELLQFCFWPGSQNGHARYPESARCPRQSRCSGSDGVGCHRPASDGRGLHGIRFAVKGVGACRHAGAKLFLLW
jgi:CelD/BcsL family acetyltransferase involved in cellulose biosynthesis